MKDKERSLDNTAPVTAKYEGEDQLAGLGDGSEPIGTRPVEDLPTAKSQMEISELDDGGWLCL